MKLFSLFTGGKDSTYALIRAVESGYEVDATVTFISENPYSYMFHTPNTKWTLLQSIAMGLKHYIFKTKGIKEHELEDIYRVFSLMKNLGYEGVVTGAVLSRYQKSRIDKIADDVGLESISPLWGYNQNRLLDEIIEAGIRFMIVRVAALGLTRDWLGRIISSKEDIDEIKMLAMKYAFNPSGEGGEYETFVVDSPIMRYTVKIDDYMIVDERDSFTLIIKNATLIKK